MSSDVGTGADWKTIQDERSTFTAEMISYDKLRFRNEQGNYVSSNERGELISDSHQNIKDEKSRIFVIKKERIGHEIFNTKLINFKNSSLQISTQYAKKSPRSQGVNSARKRKNQLVIEGNGNQI